jgi:AraC family ethanolamine operon transcriptional activator
MGRFRSQSAFGEIYYDVEKLCSDLRNWSFSFQPLVSGPREGRIAKVVQLQTGKYLLDYACFFVNFCHRGTSPSDCYTFSIPGRTAGEYWHNGESVHADQVLVQSPGEELHVITAAEFDVFHVSLTREDTFRILEATGFDPERIGRLPRAFRIPDHLLDGLRRTLSQVYVHQTELCNRVADELICELVRHWTAQQGTSARRRDMSVPKSVLDDCLEAITLGEVSGLCVTDICARAGISRRSLEMEFGRKFGLGPSAFFKIIRLGEARRRLSDGSEEELSVGDAMHETGFFHVGQFAQAYRKMFGELPSETLRS